MKIIISVLVAFFIGIITVHATSVDDSVMITKQSMKSAKETVKLKWSTLKCVQYGGPSKTYLIKGVDGVSYKIKNKNWDCLANASIFKYDVKQCVCKQLYPPTSSGGDNDSNDRPSCPRGKCGTTDGGSTDAGTTDGGTTDAGTTDAGTTDAGSTDAGTTDGGTTDAGTTDGGATDAGTVNGATDAGTLNGDQ